MNQKSILDNLRGASGAFGAKIEKREREKERERERESVFLDPPDETTGHHPTAEMEKRNRREREQGEASRTFSL